MTPCRYKDINELLTCWWCHEDVSKIYHSYTLAQLCIVHPQWEVMQVVVGIQKNNVYSTHTYHYIERMCLNWVGTLHSCQKSWTLWRGMGVDVREVQQQPVPQQIMGIAIERECSGSCGHRKHIHWGGVAGTARHSPYDPTMSPPGMSTFPHLPLHSRLLHPPPQHPLSPCYPWHARAQAALISGASSYTRYIETTLWACIVVNRDSIDL